ncbi:poly-beta-hydroxybutyrate polymerase N-terminal domain-containing protein [Acidocella sp.]|uniref:poly-beta-hydroxybutyrate polymerase N-terminal domain-containing protein n=1 Tax=Acidocella sp. TaxID=50710 RepID=UPI0017E3C143|nr:hypothetical protein [Acidocella sp.]
MPWRDLSIAPVSAGTPAPDFCGYDQPFHAAIARLTGGLSPLAPVHFRLGATPRSCAARL